MSSTKMRIEIPENPKEELKLADKVYQKHLNDGPSSPLINIEANNWNAEGPKISLCLEKHEEAELYKNKMEAAYKERDLLLLGIDKAVKSSRDVLTGVHHDNMKRLTEWGFNVTEAPKSNGDNKKTDNTK